MLFVKSIQAGLSEAIRWYFFLRASANPHLMKLDDSAANAVNKHLYADYSEDQAHQPRNHFDAVVSHVLD